MLADQLLLVEADRAFLAERDDGDVGSHLNELDQASFHIRRVSDLGGDSLGDDDDIRQVQQLAQAWADPAHTEQHARTAGARSLGAGDLDGGHLGVEVR